MEEQEIPRNSVDGLRQRMWPHPRVALLNLAPTVTSNWGVLLSNEHGRWTVATLYSQSDTQATDDVAHP